MTWCTCQLRTLGIIMGIYKYEGMLANIREASLSGHNASLWKIKHLPCFNTSTTNCLPSYGVCHFTVNLTTSECEKDLVPSIESAFLSLWGYIYIAFQLMKSLMCIGNDRDRGQPYRNGEWGEPNKEFKMQDRWGQPCHNGEWGEPNKEFKMQDRWTHKLHEH